MRKLILILSLISMVILAGCSQKKEEFDQDMRMRVNFLYEHTIMMTELSSEEKMAKLKINTENLTRNELYTTDNKLELLEKSYGVNTTGSYDKRIAILEKRMADMMKKWEY